MMHWIPILIFGFEKNIASVDKLKKPIVFKVGVFKKKFFKQWHPEKHVFIIHGLTKNARITMTSHDITEAIIMI